jgi:hypothetical protein
LPNKLLEDIGMSKARRSAEEGRQLVEEFERSGLSRRHFCEQHNIPITTLDAWRRNQKRAPRLVEVALVPEVQPSATGFALVLSNGRRIESSWRFAEADLARLIRAAEA